MRHKNEGAPPSVLEVQYNAGFFQKRRENSLSGLALNFKIFQSNPVKILKKGLNEIQKDEKGEYFLKRWEGKEKIWYFNHEIPSNNSAKQLCVKIGEKIYFGQFFRTIPNQDSKKEDSFALEFIKRQSDMDFLLRKYYESFGEGNESLKEGKNKKLNKSSPQKKKKEKTILETEKMYKEEEKVEEIEEKERVCQKIRFVEPKFILKFKHLNGKSYYGFLCEYIMGNFEKVVNEMGEMKNQLKHKPLEKGLPVLSGFSHFVLNHYKGQRALINVTLASVHDTEELVITKFLMTRESGHPPSILSLDAGCLPFMIFYQKHTCNSYCQNLAFSIPKTLKDKQISDEAAFNSPLVLENIDQVTQKGYRLEFLHFSHPYLKVFGATTKHNKKARVIFLAWGKANLNIDPLKEGTRLQEHLSMSDDPAFNNSWFLKLEHAHFNEDKKEAVLITEEFMTTLLNFEKRLKENTLEKLKGKSMWSGIVSFVQSFLITYTMRKQEVHWIEARGLKVLRKSHFSAAANEQLKGFEVKEEILGLNRVLQQNKELEEYIMQHEECKSTAIEFPGMYDKPYLLNQEQHKDGYRLGLGIIFLFEMLLNGTAILRYPSVHNKDDREFFSLKKKKLMAQLATLSGNFLVIQSFFEKISSELCYDNPEDQTPMENVVAHLTMLGMMDIMIGLQGIILEEEDNELGYEEFTIIQTSQSHGKIKRIPPMSEVIFQMNSQTGFLKFFSGKFAIQEPDVMIFFKGNNIIQLDKKNPWNTFKLWPFGDQMCICGFDSSANKAAIMWNSKVMLLDLKTLEYQMTYVDPSNEESTNLEYTSNFNKIIFMRGSTLFIKSTVGKRKVVRFNDIEKYVISKDKSCIAVNFKGNGSEKGVEIINLQGKEPQLRSKRINLISESFILNLVSNNGQSVLGISPSATKHDLYYCYTGKPIALLKNEGKLRFKGEPEIIADQNLQKIFVCVSYKVGPLEKVLIFSKVEENGKAFQLVMESKNKLKPLYWDPFNKNQFFFFEFTKGVCSYDAKNKRVALRQKVEMIDDEVFFIGFHFELPLKAVFYDETSFFYLTLEDKKKHILFERKGSKKPEFGFTAARSQCGQGYILHLNFTFRANVIKNPKLFFVTPEMKAVRYKKAKETNLKDAVHVFKYFDKNKVMCVLGKAKNKAKFFDRIEVFNLETKEIQIITERPEEIEEEKVYFA